MKCLSDIYYNDQQIAVSYWFYKEMPQTGMIPRQPPSVELWDIKSKKNNSVDFSSIDLDLIEEILIDIQVSDNG